MKNIAGFRIMLHLSPVSSHQKDGIFHCDSLFALLFKICFSGAWHTGILIKTHPYGSFLPDPSK